MNRELENTLVATYPTIYRSLQPRFAGTCLFECDDGWYRIIDELSHKLEAEARMSDLFVIGVKVKLGSLRVYVRGSIADRVWDWVTTAERLSQSTCERCGQPAVLRGHKDGRIRTLCPACAEETAYIQK
jgi:ribosomal protein S27AE